MTNLSILNKEIKKAQKSDALEVNTFVLAGYEIKIKTFLSECGNKTTLGTITADGVHTTQAKLRQIMRDSEK